MANSPISSKPLPSAEPKKFFICNRKSSKTTSSVFLNVRLKLILNLFCLVPCAHIDDNSCHAFQRAFPGRFFSVSDIRTLVNRVERFEIQQYKLSLGSLCRLVMLVVVVGGGD